MIRAGLRMAASGSAAVLLISPAAWAVSPPTVGAGDVPPAGGPGPTVAMVQRTQCVTTGVIPDTAPGAIEPNQQMLDLAGAWRLSRGEGQTIAVLDTGVMPGPRLPNVEGGGDYVGDSGGLSDCDGHGTLVAGIIGGQPGGDAFSGVAPAARLLAIRVASAAYSPRVQGDDPAATRAAIDLAALARAVVRAADLGARVIVVPTVTCLRADNLADQRPLGAALRYAAIDRDVVIVAASGDTGMSGTPGGADCTTNPIGPASDPADTRNWGGVTAVSVPSWWQPYVLSVGSLTSTGQPSAFTMSGPWLGIAAPGENIVSISNAGTTGLANGIPGPRGQWMPLNGTGYAAAYVSGVAALVRSRFPDLPATQVIERIRATAHNGARDPSNLVGAGTVDPVAALTWELPPSNVEWGDPVRIAAPTAAPPQDHTARTVAFAGTGVLALAVTAAVVAASRRNRRRQ